MSVRRKILLLGGTGFVGAALTRRLLADRAENDVMMLLHRNARLRELEQANSFVGSLSSLDLTWLDRAAPETIVHMARISGRGRLGRQLAAWRGGRANRRMVEHLRGSAHKPHVIYVSGSLVYGNCGHVSVDEDRPVRPVAFAREYILAERPWMDALRSGELPVTILRPSWIIGRSSWFGHFYLGSIKTRRTVPLIGEGTNVMSLIDLEDCAGLIAHAVRHAEPGQYYNLFAPGAYVTQAEFAAKVARYTGAEISKISVEIARRRYGRAVGEAFTFSNVSSTRHPEFIAGYDCHYPSVDAMIRHNVDTVSAP